MRNHRTLPDSELDIMLAAWHAEGPATAPAILEALEKPLTASALHSYLKRLEEKGFLRGEKSGRVNCYTPLITEEAYHRTAGGAVLEKLYDGSLKTWVVDADYEAAPAQQVVDGAMFIGKFELRFQASARVVAIRSHARTAQTHG